MCSVGDEFDNLSIASSTFSPENLIGANCRKCRSQRAEVVLRLKDAYCRSCHLFFVNHKFRASLGKSKLVKPREKLLVAFSGSMACATLLDLIHCGLSDNTPKRLMFIPTLIYIDDGAALNINTEERIRIFNEIKLMLMKYGLPAFYIPLETIFNFKANNLLSFDNTVTVEFDECAVNKFRKMFDDVKSLTSKEDLLVKLRQNLLIQVAKTLECTKILTGETRTDLATKLISNVVIGRGAHLSLDTGFCDSRCSSVLLLRPLQDIDKKAVAFYVYFKNLKSVFIPSFTSMVSETRSIQKLTENFLVGLQNEFPSTVSTIFRTGEKLSSNPLSPNSETSSCVLCQAPLDICHAVPSAFQATQMSSFVSKYGKAAINSEGIFSGLKKETCLGSQCISEIDTSNVICRNSKTALETQTDEIPNSTCYGCFLTLKEAKLAEDLLRSTLAKAHTHSEQQKVPEKIKEYILE